MLGITGGPSLQVAGGCSQAPILLERRCHSLSRTRAVGSSHAPCPRAHPEAEGSRSRDGSSQSSQVPTVPLWGIPGRPCLSHHPQTGPPGPPCTPGCLHPHAALDADSAPAAPSWGLHRKTCDGTSAPGSPGAVMETGSFPEGSSSPACSWAVFADGQWVGVCFPYKSWKHKKKTRQVCVVSSFSSGRFSQFFCRKKYGVNSSPVLWGKRACAGKKKGAVCQRCSCKTLSIFSSTESISGKSLEQPWGETEAQRPGWSHSHPVCGVSKGRTVGRSRGSCSTAASDSWELWVCSHLCQLPFPWGGRDAKHPSMTRLERQRGVFSSRPLESSTAVAPCPATAAHPGPPAAPELPEWGARALRGKDGGSHHPCIFCCSLCALHPTWSGL